MAPTLHVATYNIHKGFSQFNRRMMVHELRERLRVLGPDIVFLQEVQGLHLAHAERHDNWPAEAQHEFLAADTWHATAYGRNAVYDHGHHGNAILSRFPIHYTHNQDVTQLRFERRGVLHCSVQMAGSTESPAQTIHCVCVHLSLFGHARRRQMDALASYLEQSIEPNAPLIVAGDFNDWRNHAAQLLAQRLGLCEVFETFGARPTRSFPVGLPLLRLDRIYVRGFQVQTAAMHCHAPWSQISDHAALSAHLLCNDY